MDSSDSTNHRSFEYDVFLSFSGEDVRKTFIDHLHAALKRQGIATFKDDVKLEKGKVIKDELIKSIENSKLYIIVFSKRYASSSWCLNELVKILECNKMTEHTTYPVFYDVEPTHVRKQSAEVGKAFAIHNGELVEKWREALNQATNLAGWELKNTDDGKLFKHFRVHLPVCNLFRREGVVSYWCWIWSLTQAEPVMTCESKRHEAQFLRNNNQTHHS